MGGTCVNTGCTPTKTMIASARMAYLAGRAGDFGVQVGPVTVNLATVRQRKRDIVKDFRQGSLNKIEESNAELIRGEASFVGANILEVKLNDGGKHQLTADRIFIDTGARPRLPDIPGLDSVSCLDSTSIMELGEIPEHLLIVCGGYIGVEFGQMFRRFGSQVTIIQRGEQLLTREDTDVAKAVAGILEEGGVQIVLNSQPERVTQTETGVIQLDLAMASAGEKRTISGSNLLIAAGRTPNSEALNLDTAGIETDDAGHIMVNDRLETSVEGIYALGDVKGGPAFTHISYDDFRIVRTNLLEGGEPTISDSLIPYTVFMDPQLGRVGLNEKQAQTRNLDYGVAKIPMTAVARALEIDQSQGFMKALVDPETKQILGCAILGVQGGEIMAMLQVAMMGKLPYTALRDGIFSHPSWSEALNTLFSKIENM
jgi:pyruvate/2-oxoglutarate dehydrogenase complex dihydrolipoamide dehydrogenase (E3) component